MTTTRQVSESNSRNVIGNVIEKAIAGIKCDTVSKMHFTKLFF